MALSLDSLITQVVKTEEDPEDILASSIPLLFPHAAHNQHGNPGETLTYTSPPAQPIKLHLSDPVADEDRRLFAHYVWNASIFLAEAIGNGSWFRNLGEDSRCRQDDWSVKGEKILELGAGKVYFLPLLDRLS
jgi:nicotinamide N-methyltransferase